MPPEQRRAAVVGIATTPWYRRGSAPIGELGLTLRTIVEACRDAGVDPKQVDGFVSYGPDTNEGSKLAPALDIDELRFSALVWGGGGGGVAGGLALAKMAVESGQADCVAVLRTSAEANSGRLSTAVSKSHMGVHYRAHGIVAPAQIIALRVQRMMEVHGVDPSALEAISLVDYAHAARNPHAVGGSVQLDEDRYRTARPITDPFRLFDCSRENDGCGVLLVTTAERAADLGNPPAYLASAVIGAPQNWGATLENDADYISGGYATLARRMWAETGLGPSDIDVAQVYDHFSGAAVASMIDFGFFTPESAADFLTVKNLSAPDGGLPINTAGGNIAEGFVHGIGLAVEAVRQIRGTSVNQVPGVDVSLLIGGAAAPLSSAALFTGTTAA
jgi:acetyl-CoA acetyltransferase